MPAMNSMHRLFHERKIEKSKLFSLVALATLLAAPLVRADFIASAYDLNPTLPSASTGPNFSTVFNTSTTAGVNVGLDTLANASTAAAQQFTVQAPGLWALSQLTLPAALSGSETASQISFE